MVFPDYKKSVVNVANSIIAAFDGEPAYPPLKELDFIRDFDKTVLLVIDGLGYEFLKKYGKKSFLLKNCITSITSAFPATTASAELALETGVAPQQHAITGWNMLIKELGVVSKVLLFQPRFGKCKFADHEVKYGSIFNERKIFQKISLPSSLVLPQKIIDEYKPFDKKNLLVHKNLREMAKHIKNAANIPGKRLIYAYWIGFDHICHKKGCSGLETRNHFFEIDRMVEKLSLSLRKKNVCLVATADHGLIDIPLKNRVILNKYPEIYDCLVLPLCGDTRAPYCYVRPDRYAKFKKLVKEKLDFCCDLHKGGDFIKKGVFGRGKANPKLYERVGDYILVCKKGYSIKDLLANEEDRGMKAFHGGMSEEEMFVPLIAVR